MNAASYRRPFRLMRLDKRLRSGSWPNTMRTRVGPQQPLQVIEFTVDARPGGQPLTPLRHAQESFFCFVAHTHNGSATT